MIVDFVNALGLVLYIAMIGRVVLSWINVGPSSPFYPVAKIIYQITEPILAPIRRFTTFGMLDLSPMIAIILITVVKRVLISAL